jgi:hypothetical protein
MANFTVTNRGKVSHFASRELAIDHARVKGGVVNGPFAVFACDAKPSSGKATLRKIVRKAYDMGRKARDDDDEDPTSFRPYAQEQLAGEDDGDNPYSLAHPELAEFLKEKGFSSEEIEAACQAASGDADGACDEPPRFSGRPRPGGTMDPIEGDEELIKETPARIGAQSKRAVSERFQPNRDARKAAMDAAMKIGIDTPVSAPRVVATVHATSLHSSNSSMAAFASRWPDAARIKQA